MDQWLTLMTFLLYRQFLDGGYFHKEAEFHIGQCCSHTMNYDITSNKLGSNELCERI